MAKRGRPPEPLPTATNEPRYRALAAAVERSGYPRELSLTLAMGFIYRLSLSVWAAMDADVGDAEKVESLAGWEGPAHALASALLAGGFIRTSGASFAAIDALIDCPERVRRRWRTKWVGMFEEAHRIAMEPPQPASEGSLVVPLPTTPSRPVGEAAARLGALWDKAYEDRHGYPYPWGLGDRDTLRRMAGEHNVPSIEAAMWRFLSDTSPAVGFHWLGTLRSNFNRWSKP